MANFECNLCENPSAEKFSFVGSKSADVMLVFERPYLVDGAATPYSKVGKSFLFDVLALFDLSIDDVYITTLSKCVCENYETRSKNCIDYLRKQFKLVKPKTIVCFGNFVSKRLIGENSTIGKVTVKNGVRFLFVDYLRNVTSDKEKKLDFLKRLNRVLKK